MTPGASSLSSRHQRIELTDPTGVAEARRAAARLSTVAGLDETTAGRVALAVTEAGTNIVKHAGAGVILTRILEDDGAFGIEILAFDKGPGIANVGASMRDGHSTAGTPGGGLGALQRAASRLDLWTRPGQGTVVRMEIWRTPRASAPRLPGGALCVEKAGEDVCGDGWCVVQGRGSVACFVVDGLGHGPDAAEAARVAIETVQASAQLDAPDIMDAVHRSLRPTRGAAAALAKLQPESELCTFCGIGNISVSIRDGAATRPLMSHNGILGHQVRKMQGISYPFHSDALLVMHSDGVATRWDLGAYPGVDARHPAIAAALLYRDFTRGRDDATVLVARNARRRA
ncbi:MAG TPA: ATP-binding protein [Burkholderiales bacterium]|nr:ATP-binding protein [Burkholderiales bacterium]